MIDKKMAIDLTGKTAVVFGGSRGLGAAITTQFAKCGAKVYFAARTESELKALKAELDKEGYETTYGVVDVGVYSQVEAFIKKAADETGKVEIVVDNAGVLVTAGLLEATDEEIQGLLHSNLMGCHNVDKAAILYMKNAGIKGKICNTASFTGRRAFDGFFHYGMTKAAILYLTQAYAFTAAPWGINVNAVNPGIIRTKMWNRILDEAEAAGLEREAAWADYQKKYIPQGHAQTPEDIAYGTVFLCSDYANDITGQALGVDGGCAMGF
jgi:NAD(P)-dependent dehydrogenase (short-subunit alcohol dehydrogenase family)